MSLINASFRHPDRAALLELGAQTDLPELMAAAARLRDGGKGDVVTYSRKVFIPLTELCRDVCHYCTFAKTPRRLERPYLTPEQVLAIADAGRSAGCREALFTLGDKPELRYRAARDALKQMGYDSTLAYLNAMAELVLRETGLLPHLNPGVLQRDDYETLRRVSPSMGIMLESASPRLCQRGGPHFGSPDKDPEIRLASIAAAGEARVPLTSGILIGIGETRTERLDSLLALRNLHQRFGHIQEIIVQNFVPKSGTAMHDAPAPDEHEMLWTIAMARHVFGPHMSIQAPPNLNPGQLPRLIAAGINDWGGVSPVTPDHVNPESPWPELERLGAETRRGGKTLVQRLTIYPEYVNDAGRWVDPAVLPQLLRHADAEGLARDDAWSAGVTREPPYRLDALSRSTASPRGRRLRDVLMRARDGRRLTETEVVELFASRGDAFAAVCNAADEQRRESCGDVVSYVVNRNINYTNVCQYKCQFCAFSKGKASEELRGTPYVLDMDEVARRVEEAWDRGATEICLQGGIHPAYSGNTYLEICEVVKEAAPDIHVHAFSPLEITHGAKTLGISIDAFLRRLRAAGLGTLPGTAAEILDDEVRRVICPDKLNTSEWLGVIGTAHRVGIRTTSTIMFGHMEQTRHWARHLLAIRDLQETTGGITEFVPLPFVHLEAPLFRRGRARLGPTYRETLLVHAAARLVLNPVVQNIQASWVKMGEDGTRDCLRAGVNDLGGTLMNESISRAAGASHGQELPPESMNQLIEGAGRTPRQRTTLYGVAPADRVSASYGAPQLTAVRNRHAREFKVAS
jgi:FO synthase